MYKNSLFYKLVLFIDIIMNMMMKPLMVICLLEGAYLLYSFINLNHMMVFA